MLAILSLLSKLKDFSKHIPIAIWTVQQKQKAITVHKKIEQKKNFKF